MAVKLVCWVMRRVWMVVLIATAACRWITGHVEMDILGSGKVVAELYVLMLLIAWRLSK